MLNPDTYASLAGSIVGFLANIADSGTRTTTLGNIAEEFSSLGDSDQWAAYGDYLMTPAGIADIVVAVDGTLAGGLSQASGAASVESRIADVSTKVAERQIGATGQIGENALAGLGGEAHKFFGTTLGRRFVDRFVNGIAYEAKTGYQSLTPTIELQALKDAELLASGAVNSVEWHFFTSPITGLGGPSGPLYDFLVQHGIIVVVH